jgi:acyl carrier protein
VLNAEAGGELLPRMIRVVQEHLRRGNGVAGIDAETPLFEGGLELDSIDIVELVALVEQTFAIEFRYEDLDPEHFRTMGTLAAVVARRAAERG